MNTLPLTITLCWDNNSSSYLLTHYFITQMLRPTRSVALEAGYDVEGITRRILL